MIFSALTASLFLLQASPAPAQQSEFVQDGHPHDWQSVLSEDDTKAWIDSNWRSSIVIEGQNYPVFLLRSNVDAEDQATVADFTMAVDCSGQKVALVEAWLKLGDEWPPQKITPPEIEFSSADDRSSDKMFAFACGTPLSQ